MWRLITAEIEYRKYTLILFFLFPPLLALYEAWRPAESQGFLVTVVMLIMVVTWHALRLRENLDAQLGTLPVRPRLIAASRVSAVIAVCFAYRLLYSFLSLPFRAGNLTVMSELAGPIVVITLFSIALLVRDSLAGTRYLSFLKASLFGVMTLLTVAGAVALIQLERATTAGAAKPLVISILDFIFRHRPSQDPKAFALFAGLFVLFTYLTTISYTHRRSQIEQA
jgi:hypothetical protein